MKRKILSLCLTACLLVGLLPMVALAESVSTYYRDYATDNNITVTATMITENDNEWGSSESPTWYVASGTLTINASVTTFGDVHLILADDCTLTVTGNINGCSEKSLTIYGQTSGTGKLVVNSSIVGGTGSAPISYNDSVGSGGSITINGGAIKASSIVSGTGGYGSYYGNGGSGGSISINGGVVEAASIASGNGGSSNTSSTRNGGSGGSGGSITINGGAIKANSIVSGNGGNGGASMATGGDGGNGGSITINGGAVEADNITGGTGGTGGSGSFGGDYNGVNGSNGSFSTETNGNAVIFASSISDQSRKESWSGMIFEGDNGKIYGSSVTPSESFTIPADKTLTIDIGKTLTIPEGVTMTNKGTIDNSGTIYVDGTFTGTGSGAVYFPLTLENVSASGDTSLYNSKTYGKAEGTITLVPNTPPAGYRFSGWDVSPDSTVTVSEDNKFTMPSAALSVSTQWACLHTGNQEVRDAKAASCTEFGYTGDTYCKNCGAKISTGTIIAKSAHIDKDKDHLCDVCGATVSGHSFENISAKAPTVAETGNKEYWHCTYCDKFFSDANGANEIKLADTVIAVNDWEKTVLRLQATASKTSIKLKWNAVPEADGYVIYRSKCGTQNGFKQVKVIESGKTLTWTHKNLKKDSWNRYYVKAYKMIDGKKTFIKASNKIHLVTKGGKYTNVKKLKASASSLTLKKGKTKALKITQIYSEKNKKLTLHMRPLTYTTSDKTVATVTSKGVIKAKGNGSCYIYVTAYSGAYTRVKVTVK